MKKILCVLLGLSVSSFVTAKTVTNIVKLTGEDIEMYDSSYALKTTKGDLHLSSAEAGGEFSLKGYKSLPQAIAQKGCLKIVDVRDSNDMSIKISMTKVNCPTKLPPLKQ